MEPSTCSAQIDYGQFDAPKHFMDFKNLSNFDDDNADQWFDQHTEEGFEDTFLPRVAHGSTETKHSVQVKCEPASPHEASPVLKDKEMPQIAIKTESQFPEQVASSVVDVREELQQIERREEPEDRETFVISKKKKKQGRHSPRPQPVCVKPKQPAPPPTVKEPAPPPSVKEEVPNTNATPTEVAPPTETTPPVPEKVAVKDAVTSPKSASPKNSVPVIKQTHFKSVSKPRRSAAQKAISCIHSILSPRKPISSKSAITATSSDVKASNCPDLVRETKVSGAQTKKTYEELQMEEVKRLQNETRKRLRASRRSFAKLSKTSGPVQVKGALPTTEPMEFHFHKTTREKKGMVLRGKSDSLAPQQFISSLRSSHKSDQYNPNVPPTKPPTPPGGTKVKPFKFHLDERRKNKHIDTSTDTAHSTPSTSGTNQFVAAAEFVAKYHKATPPRFRRTVKKPVSSEKKRQTVSLTIPKTPVLTTKARVRPITAKSAEDEEREELDKIRQHQFKARPINPAVFSKQGLLGVPKKIPSQSLALPQTPELATRKRGLERRQREEEENQEQGVAFHAKPMPDFSKVTGLPTKRELPVTIPASPSVSLKRRRLHDDDDDDGGEEASKRAKTESGYQFKANPVPDFEKVFKPQPEERPATKPEPFSFEERDKGKLSRESFVEMILRKEKPAPFKAHPIPDFDGGPTVPPKKELPPTKPQPFHLLSDVRGQKYIDKLQEKLQEEVTRAKAALEFKAKDASVLYERQFQPHQSHKPLTTPHEFTLSTDIRSAQRAAYDEKLQREAQRREEEGLQRKVLREIQEAKELTGYRKTLVHKAQPIKQYSSVTITCSDKPATVPISPHFHTDSRVR